MEYLLPMSYYKGKTTTTTIYTIRNLPTSGKIETKNDNKISGGKLGTAREKNSSQASKLEKNSKRKFFIYLSNLKNQTANDP